MWRPEMWRKHWGGMPSFVWKDKTPFHTLRVVLTKQTPPAGKSEAFVTVHFTKKNLARITEIAKWLPQVTRETEAITLDLDERGLADLLFGGEHNIAHHSTWYPWKENDPHSKFAYRTDGVINPIYPVYVISKGRWGLPLTARELERMGVPYTIVVEPKEYQVYKKTFAGTYTDWYGHEKPYTLGRLHKAPENFSERGQGSIPVRNYVWDLAIKEGTERHWLMDDNIPTFNRSNYNLGIRVETGAIFRAVEVFADRYENVAITGLQNSQFVVAKQVRPAFALNKRVYSCTLLKNDLRLPTGVKDEDRWRGRYNEDTDLCIRALKAGWCTVLFVTFNADKVGTMVMKGGNTDVLYAGDGRLKMAQSLANQHPQEVKVVTKWNRAQHSVDYSACVALGKTCVLKLKSGVVIPEGPDEFGMILIDRKTGGKVVLGEECND